MIVQAMRDTLIFPQLKSNQNLSISKLRSTFKKKKLSAV